MPDPEGLPLSLDELRAMVSAAEEHPPASHLQVERHGEVVIARWLWRPANAGTAEGGHGGGPVEVVIHRGEKVAEHVHHAPSLEAVRAAKHAAG